MLSTTQDHSLTQAIRAELTKMFGAATLSEMLIPTMAGDALIGLDHVVTLTSLSTPQIWRMVASGKFPKPVSPSHGRRAWLLSEVKAWIAERKAERDRAVAQAQAA